MYFVTIHQSNIIKNKCTLQKLKILIYDVKEKCYNIQVLNYDGDQNNIFDIVNSLLKRDKQCICISSGIMVVEQQE